jgi:hypothetical protein
VFDYLEERERVLDSPTDKRTFQDPGQAGPGVDNFAAVRRVDQRL